MKDFLLNLKYSIKEHKIQFIAIVIIFVIVVIVLFFVSFLNNKNSTTSTRGGDVTEEIDPLSGQTIEIVDQEPEIGDSDDNGIDLVGFDDFFSYNYSAAQYEMLTDDLLNYFKENYENISRISVVKDSINCPENMTYCDSEVVINTGEKFKLQTDTETLNSPYTLYIQLKDSNDNILLEKEEEYTTPSDED